MLSDRLRPLLRPLAVALRRVRPLVVRLLLVVLAADAGGGRWPARVAWRWPGLIAGVLGQAEPAALARFVAAAPRPHDPNARLVVAGLRALEGEAQRSALAAAAADGAAPEVRRALALRLDDAGLAESAWVVLDADPRVEVEARRLHLLVRELRNVEVLAGIEAHTTAQRATGDDRSHTTRLHREALLSLGKAAFAEHENEAALAWFARAHDEVGPTVRTWTWSARALRRLGRLDESRRWAEQALEEREDWVPALVHLAQLSQQLEDPAASEAYWRRVLDHPEVPAFYLDKVLAGTLRIGEPELALAAADLLLAAGVDEPHGIAARAIALWELHRPDEARAAILPLTGRTDPPSVRGEAYFLGRIGQSRAAYDRLMTLPPDERQGGVSAELVYMLRRDGHLRRSAHTAQEAAAGEPGNHDLRVLAAQIGAEHRVHAGQWSATPRRADPVDPVLGRVLHVVGRSVPYAASGYAVRTHHTVRAQRAAGIDAQVVTQQGFPWEEGRDAPSLETIDAVPHHRLPFPDDLRWPLHLDERLERNVDALGELVERLRPAVLHAASDFRNALLGLEVGERYGLPVVYEMRGFWEETWLAKRNEVGADTAAFRLRREREDEAAHRATHVITLAPTMRDALIERGIPADKITLAPNAVDPEAFGELPRDDALAAELGIRPGEVVAGYISSFVAYEGIDVLIEAVGRLHAAGEPVRCLLVGDGEVLPDLHRQVDRLGLGEVVIFTGRVPHDRIRAYYSVIDVFVVPRTNARVCRLVSPLKPYEAMASARALVMSGTPVLRSIVEPGVTGLTFEPEDPDDLAARIRQLAADPGLRAELGLAARRHVLAEHTWERNAARYLDVYRDLGVLPAELAAQP